MYIIAGLGNPGKKYEHTRHNMGFLALDLLADKYGIKVDRLKFKALTGEGRIEGKKVLLVKPQTYMNLSGESIRDVMHFYKEPIENLIVIYDDIDIPEGTLRIRPKGSAGTHNGMRNIIYLLGEDEFPRIRVGIGGERRSDLVDYVIGRVTEGEADVLWETLNKAAEAAADIVINDVTHAMQEYNIKPKRLKKEKEKAEEEAKAEETPEAVSETPSDPKE
ncbi:MAG: aminoacyl-tRNA hydrolase [Clostridiales bacterium]|nr:aminoacyl-tRNA hydrolase [Clostridiales bacterium]